MDFNASAPSCTAGLRDYTLIRRAHLHRESPSPWLASMRGYSWGMKIQGRVNWAGGAKVLRHRNGRIIGTIKTDPSTGLQTGYDSLGHIMGRYRPETDSTYDHRNVRVTSGNTLVAVILNSVCGKGIGNICHPVAVLKS